MKNTHTDRARKQTGIAILIALFALMLLTAVALVMILRSNMETDINGNYRSGQNTYQGAKGGIEYVRGRMVPALNDLYPKTGGLLPLQLPNSGALGSVLYVKNPASYNGTPETIDPTAAGNYYDSELCHEFPGLFGMTSPNATTQCAGAPPTGVVSQVTLATTDLANTGGANAMPFKWVRVTLKTNTSSMLDPSCPSGYCVGSVDGTTGNNATNDQHNQICWDGSHQVRAATITPTPPDCVTLVTPPQNSWSPVYVLTALALDPPSGSSTTPTRRMSQMEVAVTPPLNNLAAVDSQAAVVTKGSLAVSGWDYCSCNCTVDPKTGIQSCTGGAGCNNKLYGIYSSQGITTNGSSGVLTNGSGATCPVSSPTGTCQNQTWPYDINNLINTYKDYPTTVNATNSPYNFTCTSGNCGTVTGSSTPNMGTPPALPPTPPAAPLGTDGLPCDTSGAVCQSQYTYVPGSVKLSSDITGNGVLIIDGDLTINGGFTWYGLVLVRGTTTFTGGGSGKVNVYGSLLSGEAANVNLDTSLGGSVVINYDQCAMPNPGKNQAPAVVSYRELGY